LIMEQAADLNNLIALFLAEAIRTRRTSLARAAEISSHALFKLRNLNSEEKALRALTELEKDFEEVAVIKQALHFGNNASDIKVYEAEIKDYASKMIAKDLDGSNAFLQDAAGRGMTIQKLCIKYPAFCDFLISSSPDKGLSFKLPQPAAA